jgi:penicillin-binding protein 1C
MSKFVPKKYKAGSSMNSKQLQVWNFILTFVLGFMLVGLLLVTLTFAVFSRQLPTPDRLLERSYELSTRFYDKDGELIYEVFGEKNRTLVLLEEIDESVLHATLATEDSNFYQHSGFSLRGYARAVKNTLTGQGLQGGSTLTQQVIKNTLLSQERTVTRKIKEFILSLQLEGRYSKDEILQMYLNESPYGGQNYGIYSASKAYFNKDPKELSIAESAYLAGLPQSPTRYSPFGASPQAGLDRKDYVLYLMNVRGWADEKGDYHYLSDEDYEAAKEEELVFDTAKVAFKAPHFIFYTKQKLVEMFGEEVVEQGGLQVTTSLDSALQEKAEEIVLEEVTAAEYMNVWNGSLVALDAKTSQVRAMVGSKDYNLDPQPEGCTSGKAGDEGCKFDPYVNVSTSLRQPGSAIKPITYATMLSQGYTAATPLIDVPTKFKGATPDKPYEPENYDGEFRGPMSVRRSLANSINVSAVKALQIVGIDNMIKTAEKMGISSFNERERYGLAITLGGVETQLVELTGAFNVFAAKGLYREPTPIVEVKDSAGNILYKWQDTGGDRALDEKVAFLISDILSDDGARSAVFGLGGLLNIPGNRVAVKTGTTDDKRDNYAVGYTNDFTVGVWVGNNNNAAMNPYVASGITGATPIWNKFFKVYLADQEEPAKFEVPEGVTKMEVDELTGMLPTDGFSKRSEWFIDDSKPTAVSDWFSVLEICKKDGNIANDSCHDNGDTKKKTFVKISSAIPEWQYAVDAWVNEKFSGEDKYFPPSIVTRLEFNDDGDATNSSDIFVSIVGFDDGDTVPLDFRLRAEISTGKDIEKIRIYMDGEKVAEDGSKPFGYNFSLSPEQIGKHTFKVVAENEKGNKDDDEVELNVVGWAWD